MSQREEGESDSFDDESHKHSWSVARAYGIRRLPPMYYGEAADARGATHDRMRPIEVTEDASGRRPAVVR